MALVGLAEPLFAGELVFTAMKALASKSKKVRWFVAAPCFVAESMLGFAVLLLLLPSVFREEEGDANNLVKFWFRDYSWDRVDEHRK